METLGTGLCVPLPRIACCMLVRLKNVDVRVLGLSTPCLIPRVLSFDLTGGSKEVLNRREAAEQQTLQRPVTQHRPLCSPQTGSSWFGGFNQYYTKAEENRLMEHFAQVIPKGFGIMERQRQSQKAGKKSMPEK